MMLLEAVDKVTQQVSTVLDLVNHKCSNSFWYDDMIVF